jgi:hypothetical protein
MAARPASRMRAASQPPIGQPAREFLMMNMKATFASLLALALLSGPAFGAEKKPTAGDISRAIAYADVMRAFAYAKQANQFKERYDKIGPGQDGLEAMTHAANLMTLANQAMRAACAREPHYVEKGIEAFRCSKIK